MLKGHQLNKNVPRVEYDHRAREARLRLIQLERRLANCDAVKTFGVFRRVRLLGVRITGGRNGDDGTGSLSDQRPCDIRSQRPLRDSVVARARALYLGQGGKAVELHIGFDGPYTISPSRAKMIVQELAALAKRAAERLRQLADGNSYMAIMMPERQESARQRPPSHEAR